MIVEIVFAAGCFWGVEKHFETIPGVLDVKSGYAGGNYPNPTYKEVLRHRWVENDKNTINYTESVKIKFDNDKVSAKELLQSFWELHDPTTKDKQGNDLGNNYRSAIFFTNENQKNVAYNTKAIYQTLLKEHGYGDIVTEIKPLTKFYDAEAYHQDYLTKNPDGYCPNHSTGVKFEKQKKDTKKDLITPLQGKEIVVIEAEGFCPYCEKFKAEVSSTYIGSLPMRTVYSSQLEGFDIKTKLDATPTILFIENGQEIYSHRGFINQKEFYKALGAFKLGKNSESYSVAFNKDTDSRFCKQYDIFKDTPDGIFVDKVSGEKLFDTKDRFNSGTGWLSFYKAVDGSTIEKEDNSYGMNRIEVLAKKSGIHLGHVFPRFDGKRRFCINATVLDFIPRD